MLYDYEFLKEGQIFPPKSEVARLDAYRVNGLLLDDEPWTALPEYKRRVCWLLANFALESESLYLYDANYFSDLVEKIKELVYGDPPSITVAGETPSALLESSDLIEKAKEGCADFIALGDWVTKLVEREGKATFINVDPSTWFPIVSREDIKDVRAHVLAWTVKTARDTFELHVQIHERGKYTNRAFAVRRFDGEAVYTVENTGQRIVRASYELGKELKHADNGFALGEFFTGLNGFAVIHSANNPATRRVCGTSDFDKITAAVMEYNVRMTLKNVVLDKHAAPKMYGPPFDGEDGTAIGNYLEVPPGEAPPGYLTWDAAMQAVFSTVDGLKNDVADLSGMGALLSHKTFGESQGYDALMIKLAPALMRTAGKRVTLEKHLKRLISALSDSYGNAVEEGEITVLWKDGIPATESVRADVAKKHLDTGWSIFDVLTKDYGWSQETAEEALERRRAESPALPSFGLEE